MGKATSVYWRRFLAAHPQYAATQAAPVVDVFGDSPELSDYHAGLILSGAKTATCSAYAEYELTGESLPCVGQLSVVVNSQLAPVCVRETTRVEVKRFCEVGQDFAWAEGEGDRTLDYWRREHAEFFRRVLPRLGLEFSDQMRLVCEWFRVVHVARQSA